MSLAALFAGLQRAGPGDAPSLDWACRKAGLRPDAVVLDAGCGMGADLGALARRVPQGRVVGVDAEAGFVAQARAAHLGGQIEQGCMLHPPGGPFDLIWSAGAVYGAGIAACLAAWRARLAPGGRVAFSHLCCAVLCCAVLCWAVAEPSAEAMAFWASDGFAPQSEGAVLAEVAAAGWRVLGRRWVSRAGWLAYYGPLEKRLDTLPPTALTLAMRAEIALWRGHGRDYGYLVIVAEPVP